MSDAKKEIDANDVWEAYLDEIRREHGIKSPQSAVAFAVEYTVAALRSPSPSVPEREALRKLIFAARTSGGTAGRDDLLCSACDEAEAISHPDKRAGEDKATRAIAADAITTFCQSLGSGAVGNGRIYYSGVSIDALAAAVALALSTPAEQPQGGEG